MTILPVMQAGLQFPGPTTALQSFSPGDLEGEYRAALSGAQSIVSAAAERAWSYKAITVDDKVGIDGMTD